MVVQHNLTAMNSNRMLGITQNLQAKSSEKLSSGYRINRAADDAAGLAISEKMRKQINGLDQASTNAQDGVSAVQTAEGALTEVHSMLQRMNELAVQAANGTNSEDDRTAIQLEIEQLVDEIDRVAETTKFNETYLLKGDKNVQDAIDYQYKDSAATLNDTAGNPIADNKFYLEGETTALSAADAKAAIAEGKTLYMNAAPTVQQNDITKSTITFIAGSPNTATVTVGANKNIVTTDKIVFSGASATGTDVTITGVLNSQGFVDAINNHADLKDKYSAAIDNDNIVITTKTNGATAPTVKSTIASVSASEATATTTTSGAADAFSTTVPDNTLYKLGSNETLSKADAEAEIKKGTVLYTVAAGQEKAVAGTDYVYTEAALYDKDGNKISANGLYAYFDEETGDYKGGLYTDEKAENELAIADYATYIDNTQKKDAGALTLKLHVGADATANNQITIDIDAMSAKGMGVDGLKVDGADDKNALDAIETIKAAIQLVSKQRSNLGAVQNRLEHTIANLDNVVENTTAAESRIRDTDMAEEMVEYSKNNILAQAGQSMLAQANQSTQGVLSLLG